MKKVECTLAQTIYRKHKAGRYDKTVVRCTECGHAQESSGSGDGSIRRCLAMLKQSCPRGERNFYEIRDEESPDVARPREFVRAPDTSRSFDALLVTEHLFKKLMDYTTNKKLITSSYDHGRGTSREYTLSYCLQQNYDQTPRKFYVKRGGRHPPESWYFFRGCGFETSRDDKAKVLAELKVETPTYDSLYSNIMRKYPDDVLRIYKRSPSSASSFGSF